MHEFELQKKIYNLTYRRGCAIVILKSIAFRLGDTQEAKEILDIVNELKKPVELSKYRLPDLES